MVEEIVVDGVIRAIVLRSGFSRPGIHFFTPTDYSQQLGYMSHTAGHTILPHRHADLPSGARPTQEVLFIRKGRLRVDFYGEGTTCRESCTLEAADVILLASGGHGFEVLEDCEMIEVKPGPYVGEGNKVRFTPPAAEKMRAVSPAAALDKQVVAVGANDPSFHAQSD